MVPSLKLHVLTHFGTSSEEHIKTVVHLEAGPPAMLAITKIATAFRLWQLNLSNYKAAHVTTFPQFPEGGS